MSVEAASGAPPGQDAAAIIARLNAEKTEAVARLAAGIAHELRNPLSVILARVQLLRLAVSSGKTLEPDALERTLRAVEEQALRAARIIENVSTFARPRTPELAAVDLPELFGYVLDVTRARIADDRPITTEVDVPAEVRTIVADRTQLAAALTQLVLNALEAMPGGGVLRLRARPLPAGVEIAVADTGAGVAAEDVPRIFEPFFSTKPAAAGLGLCVAQTIAEVHGGSIRLAAAGGPGAEFVLALPAR